MSDFNEPKPWVTPRKHGTYKAYRAGCHCEECRAAAAERMRNYRDGSFATAAEVREWFRGLGHDLPRILPEAAISRWDREHPDRPYGGAR